jgi:hypothetical protein
LEGPDPGMKLDFMYSVKFGWMIPIYRRQAKPVYYD